MDFNINMESVITNAAAALIAVAVAKVLGSLASRIRLAKKELPNKLDQKVPDSLRKQFGHFVVLTALMWMLQRTVALSGEQPGGLEVALIAGWTWAVLTYCLHMLRDK